MAMSMPVTPATSNRTTPCGSPTSARRFLYGFFSRSQTMDFSDDVTDTCCDDTRGITSIFSPQPKCIPAVNNNRPSPRMEDERVMVSEQAAARIILQDVPHKSHRRSASPKDMEL